MSSCEGITKKGEPCKRNKAKGHGHFCHTHGGIVVDPQAHVTSTHQNQPDGNRCCGITQSGNRCRLGGSFTDIDHKRYCDSHQCRITIEEAPAPTMVTRDDFTRFFDRFHLDLPDDAWFGHETAHVSLLPVLETMNDDRPFVDRLYQEMELDQLYIDRGNPEVLNRGQRLHHDRCIFETIPPDDHGILQSFHTYKYGNKQKKLHLHYRPIESSPCVAKLHEFLKGISYGEAIPDPNLIMGTRYVHRDDDIAFHQDKVASLHPNAVISTFSLGGDRTFALRPCVGKGVTIERTVRHGDLFVLGAYANKIYEHAILPPKGEFTTRVSLVFRSSSTVTSRASIVKG